MFDHCLKAHQIHLIVLAQFLLHHLHLRLLPPLLHLPLLPLILHPNFTFPLLRHLPPHPPPHLRQSNLPLLLPRLTNSHIPPNNSISQFVLTMDSQYPGLALDCLHIHISYSLLNCKSKTMFHNLQVYND